MRRSVLLLVAFALSFLAPRGAAATELPFTGTLSFYPFANGALPPFTMEGVGVADAILDPGGALLGVGIQPSVFATIAQLIPVTDPGAFPIQGLLGTIANEAGAFASGQEGFGGTMPLAGSVKVCLFSTCSGALSNLTVPLSVVGHAATAVVSSAPVNLTVAGAPWTTGTVELPNLFDPLVIAGSRQTDTLNLITPVFISTNISASAVVNSYARFVAFFDPPTEDSCDNGSDDDGDGFADFPADPGCESLDDPSERIEGALCDDGRDNDGDRRIDAGDPGCEGPLDGSERSLTIVCDDGFDNDGDDVIDFPADTGCSSPSDDSEKGTRDCDDGVDDDGDGLADFPADPGCSDAADRSERGPDLVCDDGLDNDEDLVADFPDDDGCASIDDPSERTAAHVCDDGLDQDGDRRIDYPADPGCASALDASERSASLPCDDALDNDFDGAKDFPGDPGCSGPADTSEQSTLLACDNGIDDDGDTLLDSQQDPGCTTPADPRESLDFMDGGLHQLDAEHPTLDHSVFVGPAAGGLFTRLSISDGGAIGGDLRAAGVTSVDMSGGSIGGDLLADGEAHVVVRGGTIGGRLDANDASFVEIHGISFDQPFGDVLATSGTITGFLDDGSAIALPFTRALGATIRLVPEPGASLAAVAAITALSILRTRRSSV